MFYEGPQRGPEYRFRKEVRDDVFEGKKTENVRNFCSKFLLCKSIFALCFTKNNLVIPYVWWLEPKLQSRTQSNLHHFCILLMQVESTSRIAKE